MAFRLQNDVWFCQVGEHLIFLDIREDRYFRLPPSLEHGLISYMQGGPVSGADSTLARLLASGSSLTEFPMQLHTIQNPIRSALEQAPAKPDFQPAPMLEVAAVIASALLQLKTRSLKDVLARMRCYRRRRMSAAAPCTGETQTPQLIDAARSFNSARVYIPFEPSCLLDSIALCAFLSRRSMQSTVVFGVTCNPFSAHSWVQVGDLVLNDTVGNTNSYTPIGVF